MAHRAMDADPMKLRPEYAAELDRLALEENVRLRQRLRQLEAEIRDLRKRLDQYQPGRSIPIPPRERRRHD